jgi:hypothetical protein
MQDRSTWMARQPRAGQKGHDMLSINEATRCIAGEAAVEVTIEGHAHVGPRGTDRGFCQGPVLGQEGVRNAVRKAAVRGMVHPHEAQPGAPRGKPLGQCVERRTRRPVARVCQDADRSDRGDTGRADRTCVFARATLQKVGVDLCQAFAPAKSASASGTAPGPTSFIPL